ncbi:MAG: ATP-binding cassette domain-containing protein [Amphibacillus sp.]|nr:ATP-binding cassette domain-containing protein [Amphibacillus sp.]
MSLSKEVIIEAKNLGVVYKSKHNIDDYKSLMIDFLGRKERDSKTKSTPIWPLKDVNFKAYKGEILGIVGSNGSGKTTLCKILTGILSPDEGNVTVKGKVSALFSYGIGRNRTLSGRENVYLNGLMIGISKEDIDKAIDDIHEFSGLGDFFDQPMKKYSSGMRARLGFSVAAHLDPEILILDEALNTGDQAFSKKAADKMKELVGRAKMVIIVTHSHRFARRHCDRVIWLEKGKIQEVGDPDTVISLYEKTVPRAKRRVTKRLQLKNIDTEMRDNVAIDLKNVGINFKLRKDHHWALKNISFTINEGEVIGIIGRNGAGKTTLCKVITQILKPDEGEITVNGQTTALLNYGTGFNRQLSGTDNVYLNGMLLGIPKDVVERNLKNIAEFAGLERVMDRSIKRYSSGMRARLGFSIAAALEPDIFIIDEALSTGDMSFQQKASEKIQDMMEEAKAVIIVSHSMNFVEKVCTRVIWLDNGEIVMDGKAGEVVASYREKASEDRARKRRVN